MKTLTLSLAFACLLAGCQSSENKQTPKPNRSHADMMAELGPAKLPIKTIGILLYDGFTTLDAIGPFQVLSELMGTEVFFVAKQKGLIKNMNGVGIQVERDFNDTDSLDILVIPGGFKETLLTTTDTATLNWIRKIDQSSTFTTSVCTGAWILGATGLIKGKTATTHWYRGEEMLQRYGAQFKQARWVRDGKYWTSAGVTAGMDMSLALVQEIRGEGYLKLAMLDLEYDPAPPIIAGAVTNTDSGSVQMMREMYDAGLLPLLDSLSKK